jgi:hypothetical protein
MKRLFYITMCLLAVLTAGAQDKKFSPEKFQADMEAYISQKAGLTQQEAAKLFPLMREMQEKQRVIYRKMHEMVQQKPSNEAECANSIKEYDKMNVELRSIEQRYHKKMMSEVSASKVYEVIKAEYKFHRHWMRGGQAPGMPQMKKHGRRAKGDKPAGGWPGRNQ